MNQQQTSIQFILGDFPIARIVHGFKGGRHENLEGLGIGQYAALARRSEFLVNLIQETKDQEDKTDDGNVKDGLED